MSFSVLKLRNATGIALIAIGVIAVPLPIVPGIPMIAAGAALLGPDHPLIRSSRAWLRRRGLLRNKRKELAQVLAAESRLDRWVPPVFDASAGGLALLRERNERSSHDRKTDR